MKFNNLGSSSLLKSIDRFFGRSHGAEEVVQLYAASVLLLIAAASLLAFNALELGVVVKILLTCTTLIGMYIFLLKLSGQQAVVAVTIVGILVSLPFFPIFRYALYLLGMAGWLLLLRPGLKIGLKSLIPLPILFVAIFGAGIHLNFSYQNAITEGVTSVDTFFHAAIAAMYGNYGVSSLGLDGLVPIRYHTLSHKLISGVAALGNFEILASYAYIYFAMGPLLLVFSLAGFACQLDKKLSYNQALLGASLLVLAFISIPTFAHAAFWDSFFVSESYLIALVAFIASLATFSRWIEGGAINTLQLTAALTLLVIAGLSKASVGVLGICVFGLLGITRFRSLKYWLLLAITVFLLYLGVMDAADSIRQSNPISPFDFIRTYSEPPFKIISGWGKLFFFLGIHFLPVWICYAIGWRQYGFKYIKTIEFQIIFALLIPALIFSMLVGLLGGAAYYFSSVPSVISLCFLLSAISRRCSGIKFVEIVFLAIFCCFAMDMRVLNTISLRKPHDLPPHVAGLSDIIRQLQHIRDNSPADVLIKVENPELLVGMIGCGAHWFLPAMMQRPLITGLPTDKDKCKRDGIPDGYYGLSDYGQARGVLISNNFEVMHVMLKSSELVVK